MEIIGNRHLRPVPYPDNLACQYRTNSLPYRHRPMQEARRVLVNDHGIPHAGAQDERPRVAVTVSSPEANSAPTATTPSGRRRKLGLRVALTGLVIVTVVATA